ICALQLALSNLRCATCGAPRDATACEESRGRPQPLRRQPRGTIEMKTSSMVGTALGSFFVCASAALAQVSDKPFQENWAPSKWGKDDSAGSSNHTLKPENVKRALSVVKQYKTVTLGKYYHRDIPSVGTRRWNMTLTGTPNAGPFGENAMVYHDEYVA